MKWKTEEIIGNDRKTQKGGRPTALSHGTNYIDITDEHRRALEHYRRQAGLTMAELSAKLRGKASAKTLQNIRNKPGHRVRVETMESIAGVLRIDLEDILSWPMRSADGAADRSTLDRNWTFRKCADVLKRIDQHIIEFIRSISRPIPMEIMCRGYAGILDQELKAHDLPSADVFLDNIAEIVRQPIFLNSIPAPDLVIEINDHFEALQISWQGKYVARLQNPRLLWDCSCDTGNQEHRASDCPIHSLAKGQEITKRFRQGLVLIRWRALEFYWRNEKALWPPSIDSFHMMNNLLLDDTFPRLHVHDVLDVGSGTGFLGIVAAHFLPNMARVVLHDWLLSPALYGLVNWYHNEPSLDSYCELLPRLGLHTKTLKPEDHSDRFGLILCNPPYLPVLQGHELMAGESAVAGTDLLEHLILNCRSLGDEVYVQFSDLARPEALRAETQAGVKLTQIGKPATVPFRVKIAFEDSGYVEDLLSARRDSLLVRQGNRYPYWHTVRTYRIEQPRAHQ